MNSIIKSILNSIQIKTILLILIIINFIFVISNSNDFYAYDLFCFLNSIGSYNFFILFILLLSCNVSLTIFNSYNTIYIRYNNKNEYFKVLIKNILIVCFIIIIINYIILLTNIFIFSNGVVIINNYANGTSSLIYFIWVFIKKVVLFIIYSFLFIIIFKIFKKPLNLLLGFINCIIIMCIPYNDVLIDSLNKLFLNPGDYFVYHRYSSLLLEICCFGVYFSIITIILILIYQFVKKRNINFEN